MNEGDNMKGLKILLFLVIAILILVIAIIAVFQLIEKSIDRNTASIQLEVQNGKTVNIIFKVGEEKKKVLQKLKDNSIEYKEIDKSEKRIIFASDDEVVIKAGNNLFVFVRDKLTKIMYSDYNGIGILLPVGYED